MIGEDYKAANSYVFRVPLRDSTGALQSGKSASVAVYLPNGSGDPNPPAVSELGGTGVYQFFYTPATSGAYTFILAADDCLPVVWTIQVRSLSRDELALENNGNLAAVKAATDAYLDAAVSTRAPAGEYNEEMARLDVAVSSRAAPGDAMSLTAAERAAIADAVLDEDVQAAPATAGSLRAAAKAAWAQGFGKWTLVGTTLTLYGPDGTTPVRVFALDDPDSPTERVPA